MVTTDDMLVDTLATEMLKDFVDAVTAVQNRLEEQRGRREIMNSK